MTTDEMIAIALSDCGHDEYSDVVQTHETFADFDASAKNWTDGRYHDETGNTFPTREYWDVQMFKGQPRRCFYLVDLGALRVVIG